MPPSSALRAPSPKGRLSINNLYGFPPAMALDVASSYLLSKARMNLAEQEMEKMKDKANSTELLETLKRGDEGE